MEPTERQRELAESRPYDLSDVRALYSTTDEALAAELMRKYHVDLVFVGALERRTYPASGLAKFATWELTKPVFESGDVTIYATPGLVR